MVTKCHKMVTKMVTKWSQWSQKILNISITEHQNWFGIDETLGPVAISIRREKVPPSQILPFLNGTNNSSNSNGFNSMENGQNSNNSSLGSNPGSASSTSGPAPPPTAVLGVEKDQFAYRLMIRTSELLPLRGCVLEESIPSLKSEKIKNNSIPTKEVLEFACPELALSR